MSHYRRVPDDLRQRKPSPYDRRLWTDLERASLRRMYEKDHLPTQVIATILGRTDQAIKHACLRNGCHRTRTPGRYRRPPTRAEMRAEVEDLWIILACEAGPITCQQAGLALGLATGADYERRLAAIVNAGALLARTRAEERQAREEEIA